MGRFPVMIGIQVSSRSSTMTEQPRDDNGNVVDRQDKLENRVGKLEAHVGHLADAIEATNDNIKAQGRQQAEGFAEMRKALAAMGDRTDQHTQELHDRITQVSENELKKGQWSLPVVISFVVLMLLIGRAVVEYVDMSLNPLHDSLTTKIKVLDRHLESPGHMQTREDLAELSARMESTERRVDRIEDATVYSGSGK